MRVIFTVQFLFTAPKKEHWKLFASEREETPHGLLPTHNMNHAVAFLQ